MATTNFINQSTVIEAPWLNEVDNLVHDIFSNPSTAAEAVAALGVTSTIAELNTLDGITATVNELNVLDGITSTTAELNILDGVTATAAELNILDGVTATTAELNILDGVTASTAELNILDGATITATELNFLSGTTTAVLEAGDIGVTVQGYDADTAKYDDATPNFTNPLQQGGVAIPTVSSISTLTNKALTSPVINTSVSGTAIKDEDNMASDSASHLCTQQSIKAYVDAAIDTAVLDSDIGTTVLAYSDQVAYKNQVNIFTKTQIISPSGALAMAVIQADNGHDSTLVFSEVDDISLQISAVSASDTASIFKYEADGYTIASELRFYENGVVDLVDGTLQVASPIINTGVSGTAIKDEDDMASDSATHLCTQQSIKAYVDAAAWGTFVGFRAYLGTATEVTVGTEQNFSTGAFPTITEDFDVGSTWNGSIFQPSVAGYYHVGMSMAMYLVEVGEGCLGTIYKNNTTIIARGYGTSETGGYCGAACETVVYLNGTTDYINYTLSTGDTTSWYLSSLSQVHGHFIRGA